MCWLCCAKAQKQKVRRASGAREGGVPGISALTLDRRERSVFTWIARHRVPTAWVLAGGYTTRMTMDELVHLHRLTIAAAARAGRS